MKRRLPLPLLKLAAVTVLIAAPFIAAALLSMLSNNTLDAAHYELRSEKLASSRVRIVMISDLHRRRLDPTNQQVIDKAALETPDLILVNGDMLEPDATAEEVEAFASLLERLCAIAPVYFSCGNHDFKALFSAYERTGYEFVRGITRSGIAERLERTGAQLLERGYADIAVNGESLRIGGMYAVAARYSDYSDAQYKSICDFMSGFCDTDAFKLMLFHRPESLTFGDASKWDIDLVLSGHTHNGVVALPFSLGAIWSEGSFLPEFDRGQFTLDGTELIIGAGIDGYKGFVPRIFNPPEIVVADILPKS